MRRFDKSLLQNRKDPIDLHYEQILHFIGPSYQRPNLYDISRALNKCTPWVKHIVEIEKRLDEELGADYESSADHITSEETLLKVLNTDDDYNSPKTTNLKKLQYLMPNREELFRFFDYAFKCDTLNISQSGSFIYPPGGYMSWHNNRKRPGVRVYCVWSDKGGSEFKYWLDDEVKCIKEKKGWNINLFRVENPPMKFWHSVNSKDTYRVSIGFRINDSSEWNHTKDFSGFLST